MRDFPGDPYEDKVVHDFNMILEDPEVTVICETMGGIDPAYTFSKKALLAGKSSFRTSAKSAPSSSILVSI